MADQIFINGLFFNQPLTGVQRYSFELFRQMDSILQEKDLQQLKMVCLVPPNVKKLPDWKNIRIQRVGINSGFLWEQMDLPLSVRGGFLFSPANVGPLFYGNQAVTFHDASIFAIPEAYTPLFQTKYRLVFNSLVRIARLVITDSRFSQDQFSHYLGVPASRFSVIPLGGDHLNQTQPDPGILQRNGLKKNSYILSVANQSNHKNFGRVLDAARELDQEIQIVAVGGIYSRVFQKVALQTVPKNVHLLGYVNDHELKALYQNALAFIFPSIYEGFGLPILEAMNCGCPVLCSRAASIPEVAGDAALSFDPYSVHEIVASIRRVLVDPDLRSDLQARGWAQAAGFGWEATARATLNRLVGCLQAGTH